VHSWWFAGQVVANLIAAWLIMRLVWEMEWAELGLGALVGQGFLLSVWLALGGLPNIARFLAVFFVTIFGALAVGDQQGYDSIYESWVEMVVPVFIVCFFMVLLFHGLLLPLRWLLGWRLDFDPAYHTRQQSGRLQLGLVHFLGWTTFLAIPCAILRIMPAEQIEEIAVTCLVVSAMTLPVAATLALAVTARRTWRWSLVAAVVFVAAWKLETLLPNIVFEENFLQFNLGIAVAVVGNLVVLRLFGLRLFSVIEAPAATNVTANVVQPPHFQRSPTLRPAAPTASGS
jgi:hypothetical protein